MKLEELEELKDLIRKSIKERLDEYLKNPDLNSIENSEVRDSLISGAEDLANHCIESLDEELEDPIIVDTEIIPNARDIVYNFKKYKKIGYLDHNVISKIATDSTMLILKQKIINLKNNGYIFVYTQTHIEETSDIVPSPSLTLKSQSNDIQNILVLIKELCGNFLIEPINKVISARSPIELFNTINGPATANIQTKISNNFQKLITASTVSQFRNTFGCFPKNINNCKDNKEATIFINDKIKNFIGTTNLVPLGITDLDSWINFNTNFVKANLPNVHNNDDYHYFTNKALLFEFFGYQAQKNFAFKPGLLADGVHGYVSTLVDLFICDDNKLVKSLRDSSNIGINNTEILTIPEFVAKY